MPRNILRIATRKSPLALWQANHVRAHLLHHWPNLSIELLPLVTSGDTFLKQKLSTLGGKGLFVKELEEALLDKRADLAVHSMKDVPAYFPEGLCLPTICKRHNPLDALLSPEYNSLNDLPHGAIIGTSSLRCQSLLLAHRPDLQIKELRGNIQTRISKLTSGAYDAIILAAAGLERMNMQTHIKEQLSADIMLPACGQGALGIECRMDDDRLMQYLAPLNDPLSTRCVTTERHVNALLGGHCHVPLAVYCSPINQQDLSLRAKVASIDGQMVIEHQIQGHQDQALSLAETCAQALLVNGARALLDNG